MNDTKQNFEGISINNYPKLSNDESFTFNCHKELSCFNKCCNDVNIFLTPYDIINLKKHLNISSTEFLEKYTLLPIEENMQYPIIILRMDEKNLNCQFLSSNGCTVYEHRPWACRMYPLGLTNNNESNADICFYLLKENICKGFIANTTWTPEEWQINQGINNYTEYNDLFREITSNSFFKAGSKLAPVKLEMFYMVCYNIDKFHDFVFRSTFLKRFDIDNELIEKCRIDDFELLKFGFQWLKFSLFGEKTIKLRTNYF